MKESMQESLVLDITEAGAVNLGVSVLSFVVLIALIQQANNEWELQWRYEDITEFTGVSVSQIRQNLIPELVMFGFITKQQNPYGNTYTIHPDAIAVAIAQA